VYELPHKEPATLKEVAANRQPVRLKAPEFPKHTVKSQQLDRALKEAKEYITSRGRQIRSCSVSDTGTIVAVVYRKDESSFPKPLFFESRVKTTAKPKIRRRR